MKVLKATEIKATKVTAADVDDEKDLLKMIRDRRTTKTTLVSKLESQIKAKKKLLSRNMECEKRLAELEQSEKRMSAELNRTIEENKVLETSAESNATVVSRLRETTECPVCLELPRSTPIYVCTNGHIVCNRCVEEICPKCRVPMAEGGHLNTSLVAASFIANVHHKCSYADCSEKFPLQDLATHEDSCPQRIVHCPESGCSLQLPLAKLLEHLNQSPLPNTLIAMGQKKGMTFRHKPTSKSPGLALVHVQDLGSDAKSFVVVNTKPADQMLCFFLVMLGTKEESADYLYDLAVQEYRQPLPFLGSTANDRGNLLVFTANGLKPRSIDDKDDENNCGVILSEECFENLLRSGTRDNPNKTSRRFQVVVRIKRKSLYCEEVSSGTGEGVTAMEVSGS